MSQAYLLGILILVGDMQDAAAVNGVRLSRAAALALAFAEQLRRNDRVQHERVLACKRHYEEEGASPSRALTRAIRTVMGAEFKRLDVFVSDSFNRVPAPYR
jgi:hypothetical protein